MTEAEKERAAVVAWLRETLAEQMCRTFVPKEMAATQLPAWQERARIADRIERGDHLKDTGDA